MQCLQKIAQTITYDNPSLTRLLREAIRRAQWTAGAHYAGRDHRVQQRGYTQRPVDL